jgi:hypothetical protein
MLLCLAGLLARCYAFGASGWHQHCNSCLPPASFVQIVSRQGLTILFYFFTKACTHRQVALAGIRAGGLAQRSRHNPAHLRTFLQQQACAQQVNSEQAAE